MTMKRPACHAPLRAIALRDLDAESLSRSASGGAFAVLARAMLARGGAVFGAELCDDNVARITCVEDASGLWRLQGSKYVQSSPGDSFERCREMLSSGRDVLFSGTPCQVFALRSHLARKGIGDAPGGLVAVDLVCHGVTSPELFRLYVGWLERKVGAVPGTLRYTFRSKKAPWGLYYYYYYYYLTEKGQERREALGEAGEDPYYRAFLSAKYYRKSCYSCRFACAERAGDVTIGDYWGIERAHPDFYDKRGVSLVLLNTPAGVRFFDEECAGACEWIESDFESASAGNANLTHPSSRTPADEVLDARIRETVAAGDADLVFGRLLRERGWKAALKRALPDGVVKAIKQVRSGAALS